MDELDKEYGAGTFEAEYIFVKDGFTFSEMFDVKTRRYVYRRNRNSATDREFDNKRAKVAEERARNG